MTIILAAVLVSATIAVTAYVWARRSGRVLRLRWNKAVIVTLKTGESFRGVLTDSDPETIVLRKAETLGNARDVAVDGEVLILRADIATLQQP